MATVEFDIHHESNKSHVKEIEQEKIILDNFVRDLTEKVKFRSSKTNAGKKIPENSKPSKEFLYISECDTDAITLLDGSGKSSQVVCGK
ncbi:MAG: hypothetical protein IIA82_08845 [Thaumarchaeota archaeon]|nr:hypothetical protein [Nitrososphaerota archaeon]